MRLEIVLENGEERVYDNVTGLYTTRRTDPNTEKVKCLFRFGNIRDAEEIEFGDVRHIIALDADMKWIHHDGKRTCPSCGRTYGKSVKINMYYCPDCGHHLYN